MERRSGDVSKPALQLQQKRRRGKEKKRKGKGGGVDGRIKLAPTGGWTRDRGGFFLFLFRRMLIKQRRAILAWPFDSSPSLRQKGEADASEREF